MRAFADLRAPSIIAALALLTTFATAWMLRERDLHVASTIVMGAGMIIVLFTAHMAYRRFEPQLSSRSLAKDLNKYLRPTDRVIHTKLSIGIERYSELEYGSQFPDAPKIFFNDQDFSSLWSGKDRVFLIVPSVRLQSARTRLPSNPTWLFAESGGKTAFLNQPLNAAQLSIAEMARQQKISPKPSSLSGGTNQY